MRKRRVWRYYCDYCKKSGCSSYWMGIHIKHCTMNPDRHCRMCEAMDEIQPKMEDLIAIFGDNTLKEILNDDGKILDDLRQVAGNCPACMLAAIRQAPNAAIVPGFDFKKESGEFWADVNDRRAKEQYYG